MRNIWNIVILAGTATGLAAGIVGCGAAAERKAAASVSFITEKASRGDLAFTIAASGTIEPEELVDVGSQVSGKIVGFGTDASGAEVDYCSAVTNGMVLARIDDVTYLADLDVARAQLESAKSAVASAEANHAKAKVDFEHARKDWERAQAIGVGLALSQSDFDSYQASYESAEAQVGVAAASIRQAQAQVVQAQASVEKAERNLGYCTITSPVDGIVVDRRVNLGQTVVSSMSVSSLFLVAKDLRHMRIWAAVNEADIGQIKEGQDVAFTVDTFSGRSFRGKVRRVRLNATITSNVVTYTVEIDVDNADGTLFPYLTANVEFETQTAKNALLVPSRAIRFTPPGAPAPATAADEAIVWLPPASAKEPPRPVRVKVLLNNGSSAAIQPLEPGAIAEGAEVVVRAEFSAPKGAGDAPAAEGAQNPFMPKMPKPPKGARPPH